MKRLRGAPPDEHDPGCTGHHCAECGACLLIDPLDVEAQEVLGETREGLSFCVDCRPGDLEPTPED